MGRRPAVRGAGKSHTPLIEHTSLHVTPHLLNQLTSLTTCLFLLHVDEQLLSTWLFYVSLALIIFTAVWSVNAPLPFATHPFLHASRSHVSHVSPATSPIFVTTTNQRTGPDCLSPPPSSSLVSPPHLYLTASPPMSRPGRSPTSTRP